MEDKRHVSFLESYLGEYLRASGEPIFLDTRDHERGSRSCAGGIRCYLPRVLHLAFMEDKCRGKTQNMIEYS